MEEHGSIFKRLPKRERSDCCDDLQWHLAWYSYAIRIIERKGIPAHGVSIDRRTMNLVTSAYNDDRIRSLVCFCCGQIYTSWVGLDVVNDSLPAVKSPICMVAGTYLIEELIGTHEVRKLNFEETVFRERYMQAGTSLHGEAMLREDCWEWRRTLLYRNGISVPIICCPEDVQSCSPAIHGSHVICGNCRVPLCRKCGLRMLRNQPIPMAIANHNFIGYCVETIVKYKVRWIEAAIACPVWTTMICFYLEEDRGHLMGEEHLDQSNRFSYIDSVW